MKAIKSLYEHKEDVHNTRAAEVVVPVLFQYIKPNSILDVGCGIGTWLKVFNDHGVFDTFGVDGDYLKRSMLKIDHKNFLAHDLCKPLNLNRQYDLVVSLEVAEHLPESSANLFVETLVRHGKVILFSAAIPGQGGQNHLNEQWPCYWQEKFRDYGYEYYDLIRPKIWENKDVELWYRQNLFLIYHESLKVSYQIFQGQNLVHPELWKEITSVRQSLLNWENGNVGVRNTFRSFKTAIKKKLITFSIKND